MGGGTIGVVQAYVADASSPDQRTKSLGSLSAVTSLGAVVGPAFGSAMIALGGRRAPGIAAAVLALLVAAFAHRFLRESHELRNSGTYAAPSTTSSRTALLRVLSHWREPAPRLIMDARITHAVRCAAPGDLPEPGEVKSCGVYLAGELGALPNLRAVLALGVLAHAAVLQACGIPPARTRFSHGAIHGLPDGLMLADAHQVSRYDGAGGRWTGEMFEAVVLGVLRRLEA